MDCFLYINKKNTISYEYLDLGQQFRIRIQQKIIWIEKRSGFRRNTNSGTVRQ
jgi:hypothetical protein